MRRGVAALLPLLLVLTLGLPASAGVDAFGVPTLVDDHRRVGLLCAFADRAQRPYDADFIQALYDDPDVGAARYVAENSYGAADISGSSAHGWYTLPGDRADYITETRPGVAAIYEFRGFVQDCIDAASSDGSIDWETVEGVDVWHNDGTNLGWNGGIEDAIETPAGVRRLRVTWMHVSDITQQTFLHEMGHSFGGSHSGGPDVPGESELGFDGSHWDGLAGTACTLDDADFGCVAPHYIAATKLQFGWIPPDRHVEVPFGIDTELRVERLALPGPDGALLATVQRPDSCVSYSIEGRQQVGIDRALPGEGVLIHRIDPADPLGAPARLVLNEEELDPDLNAEGRPDPNGNTAMWTPGESFVSPAGFTVQVTGADDTGWGVLVTFGEGAGTPAAPPVTSTADDGPGSLRAALETANGIGCEIGPVVIDVDLPDPAEPIRLEESLPTVQVPIVLDGGGMIIDASGAGDGDGLVVAAEGPSTIEDLTIRDAGGAGLRLRSPEDAVVRDVLIEGSRFSGITVDGGSDVVIEESTVVGSGGDGINLAFATGVVRGNLVTDTAFTAVRVAGGSESRVDIRDNVLSRNGLAIDLIGEGPTPNDEGDGDAGPNGLLNHPEPLVIDRAELAVALDVPDGLHEVQVWAAGRCGDAERQVGSALVDSDGSGRRTVPVLLDGAIVPGEHLAALTHGPEGTSELSQCLAVLDPISEADAAIAFSVSQSRARFPTVADGSHPLAGVTAPYAVLARVDVFADALSASALTGRAPLLLSDGGSLPDPVGIELDRLLPPGSTVYVMGGPAAIGENVVEAIGARGFNPIRLAGPTRVETALATADVVRTLNPGTDRVLLARADGPPGNPTAAWVDAIAGGALAAEVGMPVLLTPTADLHPAVDAWLDERQIAGGTLLGGEAALSAAVAAGVPDAVRAGGATRFETAVRIAEDLWPTTPQRFVVGSGVHPDAWAYDLVAAGLAADADAPLLLVEAEDIPEPTEVLLDCGDGERVVAVVGSAAMIGTEVRDRLAAC